MSCVLCNCNLRGIECTLSWILCGHQCENKDEPGCQRCTDHFTVALVSIFIKRGREEWEKNALNSLFLNKWSQNGQLRSRVKFSFSVFSGFFFFYANISVFILPVWLSEIQFGLFIALRKLQMLYIFYWKQQKIQWNTMFCRWVLYVVGDFIRADDLSGIRWTLGPAAAVGWGLAFWDREIYSEDLSNTWNSADSRTLLPWEEV